MTTSASTRSLRPGTNSACKVPVSSKEKEDTASAVTARTIPSPHSREAAKCPVCSVMDSSSACSTSACDTRMASRNSRQIRLVRAAPRRRAVKAQSKATPPPPRMTTFFPAKLPRERLASRKKETAGNARSMSGMFSMRSLRLPTASRQAS